MRGKPLASWQQESLREAEVSHFRRLKLAEDFLFSVVKQASACAAETKTAVDAARAEGKDPGEALLGPGVCEPPQESPAPAKPRPHKYRPRVYAPPMMALGARAAFLLIELTPQMLELWTRLVHSGIDPRRLALDNTEAKMAALLFDELGVHYRDLEAGDYDRVKAALDKIEAWLKQPPKQEPPGPPVSAAEPQATLTPQTEATPEPEPGKPARQAAPYSAGGAELDWTKL